MAYCEECGADVFQTIGTDDGELCRSCAQLMGAIDEAVEAEGDDDWEGDDD